MKQQELSRWLRVLTALSMLGCVVLAAFVIPRLASLGAQYYPEIAYLRWPALIGVWIAALIMLWALWEAWLVFFEIGRDNSFCDENAKRLRRISYLAAADTVMTLVGTIAFFVLNALHPAVLLVMIAVMLFGAAAAVASAVLSHLTAKAAALKGENDLTI